MNFKIEKSELVRVLEVIIETQDKDDTELWNSVSAQASDMLLTLTRFPIKCSTVEVSEEEGRFIAEFYG